MIMDIKYLVNVNICSYSNIFMPTKFHGKMSWMFSRFILLAFYFGNSPEAISVFIHPGVDTLYIPLGLNDGC